MFPKDLTSTLTGVTPGQLSSWAKQGFFTPSLGMHPRYLYSFEDLLALRFVASLRADLSMQKIRKVDEELNKRGLSLRENAADLVQTHNGEVGFLDRDIVEMLTGRPGQTAMPLRELYKPFRNFNGDTVVDFQRPGERLEVRQSRLGGWPTIADSRLAYDFIAELAPTDEDAKVVIASYPGLTLEDIRSARDFDARVKGGLGMAA